MLVVSMDWRAECRHATLCGLLVMCAGEHALAYLDTSIPRASNMMLCRGLCIRAGSGPGSNWVARLPPEHEGLPLHAHADAHLAQAE